MNLIAVALFALSMSACTGDPVTGTPPTPPPDPEDKEYKAVVSEPREWDGEARADVTYQLLIYSFADSNGDGMGDLKGIEAKLDYLQSLGVSALWLSPVHPADSYHGYDVTDYAAVNPAYGSEADFDALVAAAHARGIRIYLDYVLNHTGKGHAWFKSACASVKSPYRNYYLFSQDPAADIRAGLLPMFSDNGYNEGEWKTAPVVSGGGVVRYKFTLDWSKAAAPTVTVVRTDAAADADNPDASTSGAKYLYFGEEVCKKFYDKGNNIYELTLDFESQWGFLIRTSNTSWEGGTKWGAPSTSSRVTQGRAFALNSSTAADILFADMEVWKFHSNFSTEWMPDLNYGALSAFRESEPYKALVATAEGWIDRGVDGFRLDAVKHIYHNQTSDENPTFLKGFYDDLNTYFHQSRTDDIYMVGEVLSSAAEVAPYYKGLPALFEFDFWYRLEWAINNGKGRYFLKDILTYQQRYAAVRTDYIEATKLSNHDEDRTRSKLAQNLAKSKLAGVVLLTAAGSPYIYYGEEIGLYGTKEKDDQYIRSRMLWGDNYTTNYTGGHNIDAPMESSVGTVVTQSSDAESMLSVYRRFSELRNTYPALAVGTMMRHEVYNETNDSYDGIAAWYRRSGDEKLLVIHNFGSETVNLPLTDVVKGAIGVLGDVKTKADGTTTQLRMGACSSVVFEL